MRQFTLLRIVALLKRLCSAAERIAAAQESIAGISRPRIPKAVEFSAATIGSFEDAQRERREREAMGQ